MYAFASRIFLTDVHPCIAFHGARGQLYSASQAMGMICQKGLTASTDALQEEVSLWPALMVLWQSIHRRHAAAQQARYVEKSPILKSKDFELQRQFQVKPNIQ